MRLVSLGRELRPIFSMSSGLWSEVVLDWGGRPIFRLSSGLIVRRNRGRMMRLRVRELYLIQRARICTGG